MPRLGRMGTDHCVGCGRCLGACNFDAISFASSNAVKVLNCRMAVLALTGPGAAAHADVLDGSAEAGHLVALEVGEADEHIRVHDGPANLSGR